MHNRLLPGTKNKVHEGSKSTVSKIDEIWLCCACMSSVTENNFVFKSGVVIMHLWRHKHSLPFATCIMIYGFKKTLYMSITFLFKLCCRFWTRYTRGGYFFLLKLWHICTPSNLSPGFVLRDEITYCTIELQMPLSFDF